MSGHSKWSNIKRKKAVTDAKRAQIFTKLAKAISLAAKEGGGDPETNFKLRLAIDKAKSFNMPLNNIERAIKRGTGGGGSGQITREFYEAYGPGGIALLIEVVTDNKNRTLSELRHIFSKHEGHLATAGSVKWMFELVGAIRVSMDNVKNREELELLAIDCGAEDIVQEDTTLVIYTSSKKLSKVRDALVKKQVKIESAELEFRVKNPITIKDKEILKKIEALMEALDSHDDVNEIYSNVAN